MQAGAAEPALPGRRRSAPLGGSALHEVKSVGALDDNRGIAPIMKNFQPKEAWTWLQTHPDALFVDVRMEIESLYVGRPPGVVNVPWYEYPDLQPDAQKFADAVAREASSKAQPVLLICRSGKRTLDAGKALEAAGFSDVQHVVHGFEGELDEQFQRSTLSGWRFDRLPWEQM